MVDVVEAKAKQGEVGCVHGDGPKKLRSRLTIAEMWYARMMVLFLP